MHITCTVYYIGELTGNLVGSLEKEPASVLLLYEGSDEMGCLKYFQNTDCWQSKEKVDHLKDQNVDYLSLDQNVNNLNVDQKENVNHLNLVNIHYGIRLVNVDNGHHAMTTLSGVPLHF